MAIIYLCTILPILPSGFFPNWRWLQSTDVSISIVLVTSLYLRHLSESWLSHLFSDSWLSAFLFFLQRPQDPALSSSGILPPHRASHLQKQVSTFPVEYGSKLPSSNRMPLLVSRKNPGCCTCFGKITDETFCCICILPPPTPIDTASPNCYLQPVLTHTHNKQVARL